MTSSDDEYGFDDLVLDDRTLAVLDATERSLATANPSTSHPRSPPEHPPTKRLKTDGGWVPLHGQQPREMSSPAKGSNRSRFSLEDTDLPEITISNGFYSGPGRFFVGSQQSDLPASPNALQNISRESAIDADLHTSIKLPPAQLSLPSQPNRERSVPPVVTGPRNHPTRHPSPVSRPTNAPRPSSLTRSSSFSDAMRAALRSAISEGDSPALRRSSSTASSDVPVPHLSHHQRREKSLPPPHHMYPHRQTSQHGTSGPRPERVSQTVTPRRSTPVDQIVSPIGELPAFRNELESLRSRVEELKRQNAEQQRSLDQAISEKRSKIGEVEILRANLEKVRTTHNDETEKLREAKEKLEAAQVATQKQQEAELERLRTQLKFKQHEIEASCRAVSRAPIPSQLAASPQTQRSGALRTPGHYVADPQSPSPQRPAVQPLRLSKARPLPAGFVNTFILPHPKRGKGKVHPSTSEQSRRLREQDLDPLFSSSSGLVKAPTYTQSDEDMEIDRDQVGGQTTTNTYNPDVDFYMHPADEATTPQPMANFLKSAEPFDWVGWMRQLLLAHAATPQAPSTIQVLLSQSHLDPYHGSTFHSACTSLIGATVGSVEYEPVVRTVANSLKQIASILLLDLRLKILLSTLDLVAHLVICLPSFVTHLLKPADGPSFLQTICAVIVNVLRPSNTNRNESEFLDLGRKVFFLLDAVAYILPTEYQSQLAVIPATADVLSTMLNKDQPSSFLENSTRTLSYLSTRAGIFRSLLSFPDNTPESARDFAKLPQVDRMCTLLLDSSGRGAAGHTIRASILTTFISLAMAHEDALMILSESPFFIPSLVKLLAELSTALWEEDPELTASTVLLSELVFPCSSFLISDDECRTVAGIARGMLLLHYVIFRSPKGPASLRGRLQAAPPRHFNGIGHQFVVALGRLSFAEPPDEVSVSDRILLEQLADTARDVMDLVVAGPESESVWALFQEEEGRSEGQGEDDKRGDGSPGSEEEEVAMQVI
ncbi:hypothetical protein BC827DRAFT_85693 [Russula dissimulans]|nr:hypothetical protein BC827DRAFT_85693 [Russula dissimulans]